MHILIHLQLQDICCTTAHVCDIICLGASNTLMHRNPSDKWHRARPLQMNFHARLATNLLWYSCTGAWLSTPHVAVKCQRRELKTGMSAAHSPQTVQYLSDVSLAVHMTHCAKSTTGCTRLEFSGCETQRILCNIFVNYSAYVSNENWVHRIRLQNKPKELIWMVWGERFKEQIWPSCVISDIFG